MYSVVYLGLGAMGVPMARHLQSCADVSLVVYNRTADKCTEFIERGARAAASPAEALALAGRDAIIFSCLSNDAAVAELDAALASALQPGHVHVCCATISADTARVCAQSHAARGATWVSAPVFGRPPAVVAKMLHVVVSGASDELLARLQPLFATFSQKTHNFGVSDVAAANIVKLCGNFMICGSMQIMSEAYTLAQKNNIDPLAVHQMLTSSVFAAPVFQGYGKQIATGQHKENIGFTFELGAKDVGLVAQLAAASGTPMPVATLLKEQYAEGVSRGWGNSLEWSAIALLEAESAGIDISTMLPPHLQQHK